jgi:Lon protease-like protein
MSEDESGTRLPLFALHDVVHFPRTHLRLHVDEPHHRRLVREVSERDEESRRVGVVLLKPGHGRSPQAAPEIFPGGTAARIVDAEFLPNGRANVLLYGEFRFQVTDEIASDPYREGLIRPLFDPPLNEDDAGLQVVRRAVLALAQSLVQELGERFPLSGEELEELAARCGFEEMINRIAADLDLPVLRKLQLLADAVPERALSLLAILRSRRQVVDLLRPYRHLAGKSELN